MKNFLLIFNLAVGLLFSVSSIAATPLVTPKWLADNLDNESLFLLDIRSKEFFNYVRIPNSVHSDYSQWRQPRSETLQKMLPGKAALEKLLSDNGINNNDHIIIISAGESASDLAAASRVYWTLEQIGHPQKSILNGGIIAWAQNRLPLTQTQTSPKQPTQYLIKSVQPQLTAKDVLSTLTSTQVIDTRSVAEFKGLIASPDERKGTIKTALSLPYDWLTLNQSGQFQSLQNIQKIMASIDYDNNQETIVFCHTGHRAALSWFVLHELLGNKKTKLYDGSTRDWATQSHLPMTQYIYVK